MKRICVSVRSATPRSLRRPALLASTDVPVPAVLASDAKSHAVLFERVGGRTDLHHTAPSEQDVVYRHYLEVLAIKTGAFPGATALARARACGVFGPAHERFWSEARRRLGDRRRSSCAGSALDEQLHAAELGQLLHHA